MRFGVGGCMCRHGVYKSDLQFNLPSAVGCDYIAYLHLEEKADGLSQGVEQVFSCSLLIRLPILRISLKLRLPRLP